MEKTFSMKKVVGSIFVIVSGNFGHFPYLSMNTKFTGVVVKPMGFFINIAELHYQILRVVCNAFLGLRHCLHISVLHESEGIDI
jgi:hypothetical protein